MAKHSLATAAIPAINIGELTKGVPRGAWVAISSDHEKRVAFGQTLDEVFRKSASQGEPDPLIVRVPETEAALIL